MFSSDILRNIAESSLSKFIDVILVPMLLSAPNSVANQESYGPWKTQYSEAGALDGTAWN